MNQYMSAKRSTDSIITITTSSQSGMLLVKKAIPARPMATDTNTDGIALVDTVSMYFP